MKFEFHSLDELKQFINFINKDKDEIIKEDTDLLNKAADDLKKAVEKETKNG